MADNGVLANFTVRICPGRYYADASLFINIAMLLHVFDISPPLDKDGKAMNINSQMTNGLLSCVMTSQVWRYLQITHTKLAVRQVSGRLSLHDHTSLRDCEEPDIIWSE